ncbi:unnamed protein product [Brachionus calyciflorus]|uniref:EGF-like domain-containing protein n=1 Tax=Brachionus calyciflorus TaxID=104777 RepID=A0A814FH67_9BILA|nr:unnamed protein product [Brachionus calyciflorus]
MLLKIILYSSITLILFTKVCWSEETTKIECPCLNNGTCLQESNSSIHCKCSIGFFGSMCEFEICDDKNNKQCQNGTCLKDTRTNKQFCKCKPTHEGALCENEICSKYCYNNGSCSNGFTESTLFENYLSINYTMNFTCKCQSDRFSGDKCEFDLCADKVSSCPVQVYSNSKCECIVGNECDKEHCNSKGNCTRENGKVACK